MNIRFVAAGALAVLAAHAANATVVFDSLNVPSPTYGKDGPVSSGVTAMADSFTSTTPSFSRVGLLLAADNPSDGGSTTVRLVADNGARSPGTAGAPNLSIARTLGTIADASLAKAGSGTTLASLFVSAPSFSTPNNEYWIELVPSAGSSVEWYYSINGGGVGQTNQASYFADSRGSTIVADSDPADGGPYDMIVDTPEPAGIAILGLGLGALGYVRRRTTKTA